MILEGVLRMPPSCWSGDALDVAQRSSIYLEAANLIERQQAEIASLRRDAERYRKLKESHKTYGKLIVCGNDADDWYYVDSDGLDSLVDAMEAADAKP